MIVQIRVEVKGNWRLQLVIRQAMLRGFVRRDTNKAWSQLEYKVAAKYAFENVCEEIMNVNEEILNERNGHQP